MLKTLPQIIATFLAVGATFIAAYLIYLYSSQANIDEKVQVRGAEISNLLVSASTYKLRFWNSDTFLIKKYKEVYSQEPLVLIYHKIASDLTMSVISPDFNKDATERLASFKRGNLEGPIHGRIFFQLIRNSMDYLAPPEVWWPGKGNIIGGTDLPKSTQQAELYPFGPLGVEKWSNDFRIIKKYIDYLYYHKHDFIDDVESYIEQVEDKSLQKAYKKNDFNKWADEIEGTLLKIETENNYVASLLRLKKKYLISNRMPNLFWISLTGILSFVFGIAIPLIIISLRIENSVPATINVLIVIVAFLFMIGSVILIAQDVLSAHRSEVQVKYYMPLKKQLSEHKRLQSQQDVFEYEIVNQLIAEQTTLKLPNGLCDSLEKYQQFVIENNACIGKVADLVSEAIKQSTVLKKYVADPQSGGLHISIISLFSKDARIDFLNKLKEKPQNMILRILHDRGYTEIYKIKPLSTDLEFKEVESEFNNIYDELLKQGDIRDCLSKRPLLEKHIDELLETVTKLIGTEQ